MRCGLLGKKLGHSYSPQIHGYLGSYTYDLFERMPEELEDFLKYGDFTGLNVTIPYKKAVIPYCSELSDRAAALIGTYLMAIYGHERWVDGGYGPFIYLNRMLIEKKRMSLETIQRQVANFLMDFEGVQVAYPIHEAILTEEKNSIYRKHAGDVYFRLQDNWLLDNNEKQIYDYVVQPQPEIPLLYWSGAMASFPENKLQATDIKQLILK